MDLDLLSVTDVPPPQSAAARTRKISVVVPTRDRPHLLRDALASIRALEGDRYNFEIIVGDNGADPRSVAVAAEFGALHVPVARNGAGAARNAGLKAATGEFIAFLDDDDVWTSEHVAGHLALLDADPTLEAVFGQINSTDMELRLLDGPWPSPPGAGDQLVKNMLSGYYPQIGATIVRASVRDAVGLFDESLIGDQDWDWQLRVARRRKVGFVEIPCVQFRQRGGDIDHALRLKRLPFTRRVFLRHALQELRLWSHPGEVAKSYRQVLWQYWAFFHDAARMRAAAGDLAGVRGAAWGAIRVFPLRGLYHLLAPRPLRFAIEEARRAGLEHKVQS